MKKLAFILFTFAASMQLTAQQIAKENIPAAVLAAFKAKFSIAEKTEWEMDYDNYEADFTVGNSAFSATFDKEGKWLETATYIKPSQLPKVVREALLKKFGKISAYKIEEAKKVETEKETLYALEITKGEVSYTIESNENGEITKEETKNANDKKGEDKKD
jgi:Putative beta-lactamase-inhibitor-like, PepSY-like